MEKRILVVEDDASLARSLVDGLSDEGFAVEHAADGDAAAEALRSGAWELVILDWWLPGADGLTVLKDHRRGPGSFRPHMAALKSVPREVPGAPVVDGSRFTRDLIERARQDGFDPVIGRDLEVRRLLQTALTRSGYEVQTA